MRLPLLTTTLILVAVASGRGAAAASPQLEQQLSALAHAPVACSSSPWLNLSDLPGHATTERAGVDGYTYLGRITLAGWVCDSLSSLSSGSRPDRMQAAYAAMVLGHEAGHATQGDDGSPAGEAAADCYGERAASYLERSLGAPRAYWRRAYQDARAQAVNYGRAVCD